MEKAKKYIEEALDSLHIRRESMKLKLKEEQERAIKEFDFGLPIPISSTNHMSHSGSNFVVDGKLIHMIPL